MRDLRDRPQHTCEETTEAHIKTRTPAGEAHGTRSAQRTFQEHWIRSESWAEQQWDPGERALQRLNIGLASWIIQDGNYPDFETGKEYRFALEFHAHRIKPESGDGPSLTWIEAADYEFSGEIILSDRELTVLDVGLKCFHDGPMQSHDLSGQWAVGRLYLGVDPFSWFEKHSKRQDVPDLSYSWLLHSIQLETTPSDSLYESNQREVIQGVSGAKTYRSVHRTNAWEDEGGHGHYILECELLGPNS